MASENEQDKEDGEQPGQSSEAERDRAAGEHAATDGRSGDTPETTAAMLEADLRVAWAEHRRYVAFAGLLFLVGIPLGIVLSLQGFDLAAALGLEGVDELFGDGELTASFLLTNNTRVFVLLVVGALTAGLLTVFSLVFNGFVIGYIVTPIAAEEGLLFVLVGLVPHGVPELFAFFVAGGVGFRIVVCLLGRARGTREVVLGREGWRRVAVLLVAAWLLLAIAAVIEAYVTTALLELLVS